MNSGGIPYSACITSLERLWERVVRHRLSQQELKKPETTIRTLTKFTNSQIYQLIHKFRKFCYS
jgi:hypothetical protein